MTDGERKEIRGVVNSRIETALTRLMSKPRYIEIMERQGKSDKAVDNLLPKLKKGEREILISYFEGEAARESEEKYEAYMQGMGDCHELTTYLRFLSNNITGNGMGVQNFHICENFEGKDILDRLYNGELCPNQEVICNDPEYIANSDKIQKERKYLEGILNQEGIERFGEYEILVSNSSNLYAYANFAYGVKLGIRLMCEAVIGDNIVEG